MKRTAVLILCILCCAVFAQETTDKNPETPLVNYGIAPAKDGKITDWTTNAAITPGAKAVVEGGPLGAKSLKFDGKRDSVSKIDLSKIKDKLDGFDFSIAFWVRFDSINPSGGESTGNNTGLGLTLNPGNRTFNFSYPRIGPTSMNWGSVNSLEIGKWHHVAFTYSVDGAESRLYLDGDLHQSMSDADLQPLRLNFDEIGKFDGAIAGLQIWDRAVAEDELTKVAVDTKSLDELRAKLDKLTPASPEFKQMLEDINQKIVRCRNRGNVPLSEINSIVKLIDTAIKLGEAEKKFKGTSLASAPFAVMSVQAVSPIIRVPGEFPSDAEFTSEFKVAAAKNEFEPFSFIIHPYVPVEKLEMTVSDFKGPNGAVIPGSTVDLKVVKAWYQASWNSYFNSGNQILVPDLLLNDETLVKVDELKRKNYLRIEYPDGAKYCDVNFTGNFQNVKPFNFLIEPVRDAKTLQSVQLTPGRGTQIWGNVRPPKDAKSGLYTAKINFTADGKPAGNATIKLRVFPFELPDAKTNYDINEDYLTYVIGGAALDRYAQQTKDADEAERILRMDVINQRDHNIMHQMCSAYSDSENGRDLFVRDIKLRQSEGLKLKPFIGAGGGEDGGLHQASTQSGIKVVATPEVVEKSFADFKKRVDGVMELATKTLGHNDIYFYGIDEAQGAGAFRFMSMYRDYIFEKGGKIMTSGWHENYLFMPSHEMLHAQAAEIDKNIADRWHSINGKLVSYAGPFAGPDNPDLMRRSHGMRMYKANYDGFFMLSYFEGLHVWNERVNGKYRNFLIAYPTVNGPINTLSIEGLREGLDDIRYATLMRQLAAKCFESGKRNAIYAAKKAIAWFELTTANDNLDLMRLEMADHIVTMMRELGMEVDK